MAWAIAEHSPSYLFCCRKAFCIDNIRAAVEKHITIPREIEDAMDFSCTDEQAKLKKSVIEFAERELNKDLVARDRAGTFAREHWKRCAEFGIQGLSMPEEFGGRGLDPLTTVLAMEGLGYGCRDNGLIFGINAQIWSVQIPILRFGSDDQKKTCLPKLVNGEWIGAHAMTERGSGSDSFSLSTKAEKKGNSYILNGRKIFISNAPVADVFLIFATLDKSKGFMGITAFLVEKGAPGLSVSRPVEMMGLRTGPIGEVILEDCVVSAENRLGKEGNGGSIFKNLIAWERSFILASCIGTMERQLEICVKYAKATQRFGKPIGSFQSISNKLVDMKLRLETARLLIHRTGWRRTKGEEAGQDAALTKLYLSECFVQSSLDAIQIHGGHGCTIDHELERDLRDAVESKIYSGTSEMQREIIARSMGL